VAPPLPTLRCRLLSVGQHIAAGEPVSPMEGSWDPWGAQQLSRVVSAAAASAPTAQCAAPAVGGNQGAPR
jgi:hypothetical protein